MVWTCGLDISAHNRASATAEISAVLLEPTVAPRKNGLRGSVITGPCINCGMVCGICGTKPHPAGVCLVARPDSAEPSVNI